MSLENVENSRQEINDSLVKMQSTRDKLNEWNETNSVASRLKFLTENAEDEGNKEKKRNEICVAARWKCFTSAWRLTTNRRLAAFARIRRREVNKNIFIIRDKNLNCY